MQKNCLFVDESTDGHGQFQSSYEESCLREKKEPSTRLQYPCLSEGQTAKKQL